MIQSDEEIKELESAIVLASKLAQSGGCQPDDALLIARRLVEKKAATESPPRRRRFPSIEEAAVVEME